MFLIVFVSLFITVRLRTGPMSSLARFTYWTSKINHFISKLEKKSPMPLNNLMCAAKCWITTSAGINPVLEDRKSGYISNSSKSKLNPM